MKHIKIHHVRILDLIFEFNIFEKHSIIYHTNFICYTFCKFLF